MTEEEVKRQYRAVGAPRALRGRVLAACAAARRRRAGGRKRVSSVAACLAVVLLLSVYGLSPVPGVSCGGKPIGHDGVTAAEAMVPMAEEDAQSRAAVAYSLEPAAADGDTVSCVEVAFAQKTKVSVSAGTLYRYDASAEWAESVGTDCAAAAGEVLYWHIEDESAVLTARTGLRSVKITAAYTDGAWTLSQ